MWFLMGVLLMSAIIFGWGERNASWDDAGTTLHSTDIIETLNEMLELGVPSGTKRLDYVYLNDDIEKGAALEQWDPAEPIDDEAQEKFEGFPFVKVYDSGNTRIYRVIWQ